MTFVKFSILLHGNLFLLDFFRMKRYHMPKSSALRRFFIMTTNVSGLYFSYSYFFFTVK